MNPIVIAEFGSSPAPDWDFARWCSIAALSGATHCKVQLFKAEHFPEAEQASKLPLEFPRDRLAEFVRTAHRYSLRAGASVFDAEAVGLVVKQCDFIKLAAREQNNTSLLKKVWNLHSGRMVYRSISNFEYVQENWFIPLFAVQCYPTPMYRAIWIAWRASSLFNRRKIRWGWSSHTSGAFDCMLAARLGASVIEKHFCLSPADLEGKHSLAPIEFKQMTDRIFK